ncbi:hypothetical protein CERZMDRAFT_102027 [Cercospora zeae-maydis SCOH1-5]|uniref:Uncharacterized protein n=1 Tax=Cercospora zeae-maydis SCOH1-5 TaxID=717836 RepID=A0A6A6F5E1_9PEZI|nr:hypothetical protein CERZMDRAFT_102027 [Cercospora zeae-maydis SCOH1-5]
MRTPATSFKTRGFGVKSNPISSNGGRGIRETSTQGPSTNAIVDHNFRTRKKALRIRTRHEHEGISLNNEAALENDETGDELVFKTRERQMDMPEFPPDKAAAKSAPYAEDFGQSGTSDKHLRNVHGIFHKAHDTESFSLFGRRSVFTLGTPL